MSNDCSNRSLSLIEQKTALSDRCSSRRSSIDKPLKYWKRVRWEVLTEFEADGSTVN